jgi:class 3 adenylate cyclase
VVAGVIGRRKFAYDVWGDTVNTASRLEATARPGSIHVSGPTAERLGAGYRLSEPYEAELRGKGPTIACYLLGRRTPKPLSAEVTVPRDLDRSSQREVKEPTEPAVPDQDS